VLNRRAFNNFLNSLEQYSKQIKLRLVRKSSDWLSFESGSYVVQTQGESYFKLVTEGKDQAIRRGKLQKKVRGTERK
jgi:hypothetical protein